MADIGRHLKAVASVARTNSGSVARASNAMVWEIEAKGVRFVVGLMRPLALEKHVRSLAIEEVRAKLLIN